MQFERILFLSIVVVCIQGQTTLVPNYSCEQNDDAVEFTLSPSTHSAWNPTSNCALQQCLLSSSTSDSCRSSTTPCFDYRTSNNSRFCAPGILCAILEPCNSTTNSCKSNDLVCVVNSCCSPQAVCIPLAWTNFCVLATSTTVTTTTSTTTQMTSTTSATTTTSTSTSTTSIATTTSTSSTSSTSTSTSSTSTSSTSSTRTTTSTTNTITTSIMINTTTTSYSCYGPKPSSLGTLSGNMNTTWVLYAYNYTANKINPLLIFGFDGSYSMYIALDDISVVDFAYPSIQLLNNPSFENSTSSPVGWIQWCSSQCNGGTEGDVENNGCRTNKCYMSQCSGGAVEYLAQTFSATVGRTYNISFWSQRVRFSWTSNSAVNLYVGII